MLPRNLKNKIVMLGSASVGKTALVMRWTQAKFEAGTQPTIGASYVQRPAMYRDTEQMIQLWDTAGEERYRSMAPIYASGACGAVIVVDLTRPETLEDVPSWIECLDRPGKVPFILVGNKCDLIEERKIDLNKVMDVANKYGVEYFDTSASTGEGVDNAFACIIQKAFDERDKVKHFEVETLEPAQDRQSCRC